MTDNSNCNIILEKPLNVGFVDLDNGPFVEIDIENTKEINSSIPIPDRIGVSSEYDKIRMLFREMRQIAWDNISYNSKNAKAFYYQAQFMKDYEDNYDEKALFSSYYPNYQSMDYKQLRTYFTWRSLVRKGQVGQISISYAFVYIYELLNNIGVENPKEGFDKLISFWKSFRGFYSVIDRYILQWIKDYHVYYLLDESFVEFASKNNLQAFYPELFAYENDINYSFKLYAGISKYNIYKSTFYNDNMQSIVNDCFFHILKNIHEKFACKGKYFQDLIFTGSSGKTCEEVWMPFKNALFYHVLQQPGKQIELSVREIYICEGNRWKFNSRQVTEQGKKLVGYIIKEMESNLRELYKYSKKSASDPGVVDAVILKKLQKEGIIFPDFIKKSTLEFYMLSKRKEVRIDFNNLAVIRDESFRTKEKLIIPEEQEIAVNPGIKSASALENVSENLSAYDENEDVSTDLDKWQVYKNYLSQIEREALKLIFTGRNLNLFAQHKGVMPEILLDEINQKAMDFLGDTLMEFDEISIEIYDEYKSKVKELVEI